MPTFTIIVILMIARQTRKSSGGRKPSAETDSTGRNSISSVKNTGSTGAIAPSRRKSLRANADVEPPVGSSRARTPSKDERGTRGRSSDKAVSLRRKSSTGVERSRRASVSAPKPRRQTDMSRHVIKSKRSLVDSTAFVVALALVSVSGMKQTGIPFDFI